MDVGLFACGIRESTAVQDSFSCTVSFFFTLRLDRVTEEMCANVSPNEICVLCK